MTPSAAFASPNVIVFGPSLTTGESRALGMDFDAQSPYSGCRLCGALFQSALDRTPVKTLEQEIQAVTWRREWTLKHAKEHPTQEHIALERSGMWATPEATQKLAAVGIVPVSDIVRSQHGDGSHEQAGLSASRVPVEDSEDRLKGYR